MLDAMLCPDWDGRYYSYNSRWAHGEEIGSFRNGQGDFWFLHIGRFGAGIVGSAHESKLAGDGALLAQVRRAIPGEFSSFLNEPAFGWDRMSYCFWRSRDDRAWSRVEHLSWATFDDGSLEHLALLHEPASSYAEFAKWYYERSLPISAVEAIFGGAPVTQETLKIFNPEMSLGDLLDDAAEIGFTVETG